MKHAIPGFTLIELLVVISVITVLAAVVILAINPRRQFALARNARRQSDVKELADAFAQYASDNQGSYPPITQACDDPINPNLGQSIFNFVSYLTPLYIAIIPNDPLFGASYYRVCHTLSPGNERVSVYAPGTELGIPLITSTR